MSGVPFKDESDAELVDRAIAQAESEEGRAAASALLERYRERVYVWCRRYVRDHERACDLVQEVLLSAYRNLGTFSGRAQFSSWLFAIARNRCINEVHRVSLLLDEEMDPDQIAARDGDPAADLEQALDERALLALICEHLTPREQEAIWLRCVDRMPVETVTRVLGIEERSGARAVLQQARRKLRAALEREAGR
jgi:RNA polymerase sigma-70 factor (ECF subfamily)